MVRHLLVAIGALSLIILVASIGADNQEKGLYAMVAASAGIGAVANSLWRRRRNMRVSWRNVFAGAWASSIALPGVITMLDGSSAGYVGLAIGTGISAGGIVSALLGFIYWIGYGRTRVCPYCAERILSEARVCKYCHRDVEAVGTPGVSRAI